MSSTAENEPMYVISVAARLVNVHPQTLRYYERVGLVKPKRSGGRIRLYSQRDVQRLNKIARLTSELGVNLAGVQVIMDLTEKLEQLQLQLTTRESRETFEFEEGQVIEYSPARPRRTGRRSTRPLR